MSEKDFTIMHSRNMQQVSVTQRITKVLTLFITYAFLIVMALIVLFPFYWMIISSLKSLDEYRASVPTFWPRMVLISNYADAFSTGNLGRLFLNTAYVGIVSTMLSLIITILTAFAFARLEFKGKNALFGALLNGDYDEVGYVYVFWLESEHVFNYVKQDGVYYACDFIYGPVTQSGTDALVIGTDGNFRIITEGETSADTLVREGAWQVLTFGPALINGGQVTVSSSDEVGRAMTSNPRTAIGQISEGHYLLVVSDGRTKESTGLSLRQLAELMQSLGAQIAYNLDGGSSCTVVLNNEKINSPSNPKRREVGDCIYFATLIPNE